MIDNNTLIVIALNSMNELRELAIYSSENEEKANEFYEECQKKYDQVMIYSSILFGKCFLVGHYAKMAFYPQIPIIKDF